MKAKWKVVESCQSVHPCNNRETMTLLVRIDNISPFQQSSTAYPSRFTQYLHSKYWRFQKVQKCVWYSCALHMKKHPQTMYEGCIQFFFLKTHIGKEITFKCIVQLKSFSSLWAFIWSRQASRLNRQTATGWMIARHYLRWGSRTMMITKQLLHNQRIGDLWSRAGCECSTVENLLLCSMVLWKYWFFFLKNQSWYRIFNLRLVIIVDEIGDLSQILVTQVVQELY